MYEINRKKSLKKNNRICCVICRRHRMKRVIVLVFHTMPSYLLSVNSYVEFPKKKSYFTNVTILCIKNGSNAGDINIKHANRRGI